MTSIPLHNLPWEYVHPDCLRLLSCPPGSRHITLISLWDKNKWLFFFCCCCFILRSLYWQWINTRYVGTLKIAGIFFSNNSGNKLNTIHWVNEQIEAYLLMRVLAQCLSEVILDLLKLLLLRLSTSLILMAVQLHQNSYKYSFLYFSVSSSWAQA